MKRPGRREDEIARLHRDSLAVNRRIGAFACEDELQRGRGVAMAVRDLAGQDELQAGVEAYVILDPPLKPGSEIRRAARSGQ
jgi:hypothetical protein